MEIIQHHGIGTHTMIKLLPGSLRGILSLIFYGLNTFFWTTPLFVVAGIKLLVPVRRVRTICSAVLNFLACRWIGVNNFNQEVFNHIKWDVSGIDDLKKNGWYMVVANHQSWVDILVLQRVFHQKIPFLKFFLKKELFWFPILGLAWWALDFPFMKRFTKSYLKKNPHMKGKDLEITQKACEKFKTIPVSVMNFVEGTRFTRQKRDRQRSPYAHLLRTRAGGVAFVLSAMGKHLNQILDVTIAYPDGKVTFWEFVTGQIREIRVEVNSHDITQELMGDYSNDMDYRKKFHAWLNTLWQEKDSRLDKMLST